MQESFLYFRDVGSWALYMMVYEWLVDFNPDPPALRVFGAGAAAGILG